MNFFHPITENLNSIQNEAKNLCKKIAIGYRSHIIKPDLMILCCTKDVRLFETPVDDKRKEFLDDVLPAMHELISDEMCSDDLESSPIDAWQADFEDNAHSESNGEKFTSSSKELDDIIDDRCMQAKSIAKPNSTNTSTDSGCLYEISSGSEFEAESRDILKKKRRKRQYTDCKLLSKFREEKKQQSEKANSGIVMLMDILENSIPALPLDNPTTPVLKNIYQFCLHLNTKFNNMNEKNLLENSIPLTRKIKQHKVKGKDEINLNGLLLPLTQYAVAIAANEPRLVMSRLMRGCISDQMKDNCQVNDNADDSNFLYRIGDSNLEGDERLANGRERIEMLIGEFIF